MSVTDAEALAFLDEHVIDVAASPESTWDAALSVTQDAGDNTLVTLAARALGCDPATTTPRRRDGDDPVGTTVPGFRIVQADRPKLLVLRGRHRFSSYAIVLRVDATPDGARCCFESRAVFPGPHGRLYRLAVVGSGGHGVAVRRLLRRIRDRAERPG